MESDKTGRWAGIQPHGALQVSARSWCNSEYIKVSVQRSNVMCNGDRADSGCILEIESVGLADGWEE